MTATDSLRRILIVDDNPLVGDALGLTLGDAGFDVLVTTSWRQTAIECTHQYFDLIVSDLQMPGMRDAEIVSLLRAHYPDTPIVAMSAWAHPGARDIAQDAGAQVFLPKPCPAMLVLAAIEAISARHSLAA